MNTIVQDAWRWRVWALAAGGMVCVAVAGCPSINIKPIADAGVNQTVQGESVVVLDGSGSDDPDGRSLSYSWRQTTGTTMTLTKANTATPGFLAPSDGQVLTFELTVTDADGSTDTNTVTVTVLTVNHPPVPNAGPDQTVLLGVEVTLDGSGSSDPEGVDLAFSWTQTSGDEVELTGTDTAAPTFTAPDQSATLVFQLAVSDGVRTRTDSVTITVTHQPPAADAGDDQTVLVGAAVTLDGSASSDPEGADLTFAWSQDSGDDVTLTGADTAAPTFTAPNDPGTLVFTLTVSDGDKTATGQITITVQPQTTLFVSNAVGDNVVVIRHASTADGNVGPDANLEGPSTALDQPWGVAVSSSGVLLVANRATPSITAYDDADANPPAYGNTAPDRTAEGAATLLATPVAMAIDAAADVLLVADAGATDTILIFESASSLDGDAAPDRFIRSTDLDEPIAIATGASSQVYVANAGANNIVVFTSDQNGDTVPASRTLTLNGDAFADLQGLFVSADDHLFVAQGAGGGNVVHMFADAATLGDDIDPAATLTVTGATNITAIAVDSNGTGYIADQGANAIYVFDSILSRNGTFEPDRTISGANTQLSGPADLFVLE